MKLKKMVPVLALVLALGMVFSGCTASFKLAKAGAKLGEAMKQQPITSAAAELSCTAKVTNQELGLDTETRFRTVVHTRVDWDGKRSISDITASVNLDGTDLTQTMQCYSAMDEGKTVRYVHADSLDLWLRQSNRNSMIDLDPGLIMMLLDKVSDGITMETVEGPNGGAEHHLIKLCFVAQDIRDFMEKVGLPIPEELRSCSLDGVIVPVEMEIEDKTYLPIRVQAKIQGISASLVDALAKTFGKDLKGFSIDLEEISILITNFGYEDQNVPMLPMGAAENALDLEKMKEFQK